MLLSMGSFFPATTSAEDPWAVGTVSSVARLGAQGIFFWLAMHTYSRASLTPSRFSVLGLKHALSMRSAQAFTHSVSGKRQSMPATLPRTFSPQTAGTHEWDSHAVTPIMSEERKRFSSQS